MDLTTFNNILQCVSPYISVNWTNFNRMPIGVEERLVVTLRFLATGASFRHLAFAFRMGRSTVASIVKEMTSTLWNVLQPIHMPVPTEATFRQISDDFMQTWNFPHCIGAIGGKKHIKIKAPLGINGVCDANYKLIMIDIGGYGKQSDGGTFQNSDMYKLMHQKKLDIPDTDSLPDTDLTNLLKPYSRNHLTLENLNFNQRLSRARKTIEWRLLSKPIETYEKTADDIIKAICILHNTILDREGIQRHLRVVTTNAVSKDNVFMPPNVKYVRQFSRRFTVFESFSQEIR
nr:unnamed protein product [Callosobruchus analis]